MSFFVVGLPRSMTAWMANFLTYDGNYCFHEGMNGCHSLAEYKRKIMGCGDSGTGIMLIDIEKEFPDAKVLIIERDPRRAEEFAREHFGEVDLTYIKERLNKMGGMRVKFEEVKQNLESIWGYLIGTPYDSRRGELLCGLNIQVNLPYKADLPAAKSLTQELIRSI